MIGIKHTFMKNRLLDFEKKTEQNKTTFNLSTLFEKKFVFTFSLFLNG